MTSTPRHGMRSFGWFAFAAGACMAACAAGEMAPPPPPAATVRELIGNAACQSDAQCATVGVGGKACGGPDAYLAWSTGTTDEGTLRATAQREAAADRKVAAAKGMVSRCDVVRDPGATCVGARSGASGAGVCRLRTAPGLTGSTSQ